MTREEAFTFARAESRVDERRAQNAVVLVIGLLLLTGAAGVLWGMAWAILALGGTLASVALLDHIATNWIGARLALAQKFVKENPEKPFGPWASK